MAELGYQPLRKIKHADYLLNHPRFYGPVQYRFYSDR